MLESLRALKPSSAADNLSPVCGPTTEGAAWLAYMLTTTEVKR